MKKLLILLVILNLTSCIVAEKAINVFKYTKENKVITNTVKTHIYQAELDILKELVGDVLFVDDDIE